MDNIAVEVGELLRCSRLNFGYTIQDIEHKLNIRVSHIDAIENGDISELPGKAYAIGFVRSYAEYLGLDSSEIIYLFKTQYIGSKPKLSYPEIVHYKKIPNISLIIISLLFYGVFMFSWRAVNKVDPELMLQINPIPEDIKYHVSKDILSNSIANNSEDVTLNNPENTEAIEDMGSIKNKEYGVILNIINSSWVEIKDSSGQIIISNILEKGDQYFVPDSPGLTMSLGNAANVEITINNRALMPLGKDGDVRRDIPLDTYYLKTLEFKEAVE